MRGNLYRGRNNICKGDPLFPLRCGRLAMDYFPPYFIIGLPEASIAALERWDHIHFAYLRNSLASGWGYCSFWGAKFGGYLSPAVYLPNAACSAGPPIFLFKSSPFGIYLLLCVKAKRQEVHQNLRRRAQGWHKENIRWDFLRLQSVLPALNPNGIVADFRAKVKRAEGKYNCSATQHEAQQLASLA